MYFEPIANSQRSAKAMNISFVPWTRIWLCWLTDKVKNCLGKGFGDFVDTSTQLTCLEVGADCSAKNTRYVGEYLFYINLAMKSILFRTGAQGENSCFKGFGVRVAIRDSYSFWMLDEVIKNTLTLIITRSRGWRPSMWVSTRVRNMVAK